MNLINAGSVHILRKNIENILKLSRISGANIESNILISHFLHLSKEEIILKGQDIYPDKESLANIKIAINRRLNGEPISHIIGRREFYSINFDVNEDVLDPRPDSEILIEEALKIIADISSVKKVNILELGVGSGCLVLTLLKNVINSKAIAVDINPKSIIVAKKNAVSLGLDNRIKFIQSNWFNNLDKQEFDIIISNPPYIKSNDIINLQKEVKDCEPLIALDGGKDGLECYRIIAANINNFLHKKSFLILEIGHNMENDVINIFKNYNFKFIKYARDLNSIIRCLIFSKE